MFKDNLLFKQQHENIAIEIADAFRAGLNVLDGIIISIFGICGTGKSEVAWWLARKLYLKNFSSHIVSLDRFYKIPVSERELHRKETEIIGSEEIDWESVKAEIEEFKNKSRIDVLIVEGLYAGLISAANMRVYLKSDIESTYAFRKQRGKENPDDEWRQYVLKKEYDVVIQTAKNATDIFQI